MRPLRATTGLADWRALLADPDRHWQPGYSAMATAQSWEAGFPPEVAQVLGRDAELQLCIVEHKVVLPGGGFPSQCDVFALAHAEGRDMAVALEAKVGEPFGPTIGDWLSKPSRSKEMRLTAILDWLGLEARPVEGLRYQLFHRTAAAIVEARRFRRPVAAMVVQSFSPEQAWFDDFAGFCALFGFEPTPGEGRDVTLPDGLTLRLGWACGDAAFLKVPA